MASSELVVASVKDLPPGTQAVMQTMAAIQLYRSQREVANYFEVAYLQLGNLPDVAKEIRMTATNARMQHHVTTGLMKKFTVTASQIVETMIPMIIDAVELKDPDIVKSTFNQVLGLADSMKKEAEETQASYHQLQAQVQTNMSTLNERNKQIMDDDKKRAIEFERENDLLKAAKLNDKQLQDEKQKIDEDLKKLRTHRDNLMERKETTFLDHAIALGGETEPAVGIIQIGVNIFKSIFGDKKKTSQRSKPRKENSVTEALKECQISVVKLSAKNQEAIERIHKERVGALERLTQLKKLALDEVGIGNAEALREASAHLGNVDKQFTRIIQFWTSMAAILKYLTDDTKAGEAYLKKIENPVYVEKFMTSVARSKQGWTNFSRICSDYIVESDEEINTLYAFLSAPIGKMKAVERKTRLKELLKGIEDDIYSTYPQE